MCGEGWTEAWSSLVCAQAGFARAEVTSHTSAASEVAEWRSWWRLNNSAAPAPELIQNFASSEAADTCDTAVSVQCEQFGNDCLVTFEYRKKYLCVIKIFVCSECGQWPASSSPWPSLALLLHTGTKAGCPATVVSPRHLLTATSCMQLRGRGPEPAEWVVFAGPASAASILDMERSQILAVQEVASSPGARQHQHLREADLSLVSLHSPLVLSSVAGAACLDNTQVQS